MSRLVEAPKVDIANKESVMASGVNVHVMRMIDYPSIDAVHAREDKRLLKRAVEQLNLSDLFPIVELKGPIASGSEQQAYLLKLLPVASEEMGKGLQRDIYLNPEGELVCYFREGEQTEFEDKILDKDYVRYTEKTLQAIEKRFFDALSDDQPKLRIIEGQKE